MKKKKYREIYHIKTKETKKKKINNNMVNDPVEIANNTPESNKNIFAFKSFLEKKKSSDE